jgi:hypothetical protein
MNPQLALTIASYDERLISLTNSMSGINIDYDFDSSAGRMLRYSMLWAMYEGTVFRAFNSWSTKHRTDHNLYKYTRDIYNPTSRIGTFYQTYLLGGDFEYKLGDVPVKLPFPFQSNNEKTDAAIRKILKDSNAMEWRSRLGLLGSLLGDVFIKVCDDGEKITLECVSPEQFPVITVDNIGNVTYYQYEEEIRTVSSLSGTIEKTRYTEICYLENGRCVFETFRNGIPFDWGNGASKWIYESNVIPLIHIKHNDVGRVFGASEVLFTMPLVRELEDITSKVSDQIRKMVDSPWFFAGVKIPNRRRSTDEQQRTDEDPSRRELPAIYSNDPHSKPYPLVAPLDLEAALNHISNLYIAMEKTFPELRLNKGLDKTSGDVSGRALIVARQEAQDKVALRRQNYDNGLVKAITLALRLSLKRGYIVDITEEETLFSISDRPVFLLHESERLEYQKQFWTNAELASKVGVGLDVFLQLEGWSPEQIRVITESEDYKKFKEMTTTNLIDPFTNNTTSATE